MENVFSLITVGSLIGAIYFWRSKKKLKESLGGDYENDDKYKEFTKFQNIAIIVLLVSAAIGSNLNDNNSSNKYTPRVPLELTTNDFISKYNYAIADYGNKQNKDYSFLKAGNITSNGDANTQMTIFSTGNNEINVVESKKENKLLAVTLQINGQGSGDSNQYALFSTLIASNCGEEHRQVLVELMKNGGGERKIGNVVLIFNLRGSTANFVIMDSDFDRKVKNYR